MSVAPPTTPRDNEDSTDSGNSLETVIEELITPNELEVDGCSCCCCFGKCFKCIWISILNCIECVCKSLSYICIGSSKCAMGCHNCLEEIDCDGNDTNK
jgi:hypothetical protein